MNIENKKISRMLHGPLFYLAVVAGIGAFLYHALYIFRVGFMFGHAVVQFVLDIFRGPKLTSAPFGEQLIGIGISAIAIALLVVMVVVFIGFLRTRQLRKLAIFAIVFFISVAYYFSFYPGFPLETLSQSYCWDKNACHAGCSFGVSSCDGGIACVQNLGCHPRDWNFQGPVLY